MCVLSPLCGDVMDSQGDAKDGQSPVADVTSQMPLAFPSSLLSVILVKGYVLLLLTPLGKDTFTCASRS